MERKTHHAQLLFGVAADNATRDVNASLAGIAQRHDLGWLAGHKQAHDGERIHANVEHGAAGEAAVVEARVHVVGLEAAEAHLSQVHAAEVPGFGTGDELTV